MRRTYPRIAALCALLAAVVVGAVLYALLAEMYVLALILLLILISLMEIRVRLGYTLPRGGLFYLHVISGSALLLLLAGLVYSGREAWLPILLVLYTLMFLSGSVLLYRNISAHG